MITAADGDLMAASFIAEGEKEETTSRVAKVVDGIVATGNWALKRNGDLI